MNLWPHQPRAVDATFDAIAQGCTRLCLTGPTGCGKSVIMQLMARRMLEERKKVVLYTNRKMLVDQLSDGLMDAGIYHGVRAAGYADERDHPFQIASIQTEHSRSMKKKTWELHDADLVLVDEGHLHTGPTARAILDAHRERGAAYVMVTATPIDMGEVCDRLIVAATTSECRRCGALVLAHHFGPDEPDLKSLRGVREGEDLTEKQSQKAMGPRPELWGRVWDNFERLNPEHKATILFASGVQESIWFAEQFTAKGVRAAHIDGEDIWIDGTLHRSSRELRQEVLGGSRDGRIVVLCNRFVLREGIDAPWLAHGVLATVFGSVQTYLQSGGRLLRSYGDLASVTVQDHGGNWWRHGSLNEDREWDISETAASAYGIRADRIRKKVKDQPFRCPKCSRTWTRGRTCHPAHGGCGYELPARAKFSRPVVTAEGTLRELGGDVFRPKSICQRPDGPKIWERMYWRSRTKKGRRSFRAAAALFAQENYWQWPDPNWPLMPTRERDWYLHVVDVPMERLTGHRVTVD